MTNKLCLVMIVKDEAKIIERCLESVKDIIDCYSIVDTGSADGTKKIIEDFFFKHNIPGGVYVRPWKNFGHNRSEAFELAKTNAEYSLLVDADMVVKISPDFKKELSAECYFIKQVNGNLVYQNTRILKNSLAWKCIGVTHEYWKADDCFNGIHLDGIHIEDINDGGSRGNKFDRDITLLEQGIEEDPGNARYMFYLANSYRDVRMYDKAIEWYTKRIEAGGFEEEVWHAMYQRGMCRIWKQDQALTIINDLLMAVDFRRWRMEPLYQLLRYFRETEQYATGYVIGKALYNIQYPKFDILFIEKDVYDWKLNDEISLAAWYAGHKEEAKHYSKLALDSNLPEEDKDRIEKNLTF